jgi:hypothetical protein
LLGHWQAVARQRPPAGVSKEFHSSRFISLAGRRFRQMSGGAIMIQSIAGA